MDLTIATAPKTSTFQMRINPEIKRKAEEVFSGCGLTLTEAINAFLQQSINVEGLPFIITTNSKEALRQQAIAQLLMELNKGEASAEAGNWISEEEALKRLGVSL